jgi:hypothetical protein
MKRCASAFGVEGNFIPTMNRPTIGTFGDTVVIGCLMNRRAVSILSLAVETGVWGKVERCGIGDGSSLGSLEGRHESFE